MQYFSAPQVLAALERRAREIDVALTRAQELRTEYLQARQGAQHGLAWAERALPQVLIPDLREDVLGPLANVLGFPWLRSGRVAAMNAERAKLVARQAEIEADPAWVDRVELCDPEKGTLAPRIRELGHHIEALRPVVEKFSHPRLQALLDNGYGTDAYATPFWRTSYYADRKAAEEILARCPAGTTFKEAREEYLQSTEALAALESSLAGLQADLDRGIALEKEHGDIVERLRTLREAYLEEARARTASLLLENPPLLERIEPLPAAAPVARRMAGLVHKIIYLDGLVTAKLDPLIATLMAERQALLQEAQALGTPARARERFTEGQLGGRFHGRHDEAMRHLDKVLAVLHTLNAFDEYERGRVGPGFLWWDLMTDGRWKGDFIPQVRDFRLRYPEWRYEPIVRRGAIYEDD